MTRVFVILALLFGTIYVFLIPPFQAPDEVHHFYRSYHVAEGNWIGEKTEDQRFGGVLPNSLEQFSNAFRYLRYAPEAKTNLDSLKKVAQIPLLTQDTVFLDFPNVAYYATSAYLPQSVAVRVGVLLEMRPIYLFYLTRFINLLFWITFLYFSLRVLPFHQFTFAFLALLPASLVFHAGINADAVTNACCFLLLTHILALIFTEKSIQKKQFWLLVLSTIITINKVVYAPIFLLFWLIPIRKFGGKRNYFLLNLGLLIFHAALLAIWYKIAGNLFIPYDEYNPLFREDKQLNPGVAPLAQLDFILSEPLEFLKILFSSYLEIFPYTLIHYVGKFGWEGNYLPIWMLFILLLALLVVPILDQHKKIELRPCHRLAFISIGLIMMLAFSVVIYMQWNAPRDPQITALSGRYFIPIFPLFFLALYQRKWKWLRQNQLKMLIICITVLGNLVGIYSVWMRYYQY
ncbi:MAG: DUF2142 domain-containing protein [Bacteroidota bacterium]